MCHVKMGLFILFWLAWLGMLAAAIVTVFCRRNNADQRMNTAKEAQPVCREREILIHSV
jgi:dipeptide/tripeptide permease